MLKTATSYSARQSVSNQQDGSSSKPASDSDVVVERDSTASRDSGRRGDDVAEKDNTAGRDSYIYHYNWSTIGGGGVVAGRKSTVGGPDNFPDSSFSATPAPRFSMTSQRPQQSMQNSAFEEKTKFSERTSRSFVSKSQKQVSQPKALAFSALSVESSSVRTNSPSKSPRFTTEEIIADLEAAERDLLLQQQLRDTQEKLAYAQEQLDNAQHGHEIARHVHAIVNPHGHYDGEDDDFDEYVDEDGHFYGHDNRASGADLDADSEADQHGTSPNEYHCGRMEVMY